MAEKRFIKGLFKDTAHIDQPAGSWRYAKNVIINNKKGSVSNEGGTHFDTNIVNDTIIHHFDQVVGAIEVDNDRVVLFILDVNPNAATGTGYLNGLPIHSSMIGIWEKGNFRRLLDYDIDLHGHNLNFNVDYPIEGTFKVDARGDLIVYWTDDLNPPRAFNVSRQERWLDSGGSDAWLYGITPWTTHLNHVYLLNLFPHSGPVPTIAINEVIAGAFPLSNQSTVVEGGGLRTGVYYLALAYVDEDLVATNYLTVSNPISIVEEYDHTQPVTQIDGGRAGNQTSKAINWSVSNINTDYDFIRPVVVRKMGDATEAFRLDDIERQVVASNGITFSGTEGYSTGSVEDVIIDTTSYETAKTINQLDGVLYLGNLTGSQDVGYQKYANFIKLSSVVTVMPNFDIFFATIDNLETGFGTTPVQSGDPTTAYRYLSNIYDKRGYMRDEVYAFYIAFILNDGSMSYAYHIPGRDAVTDIPANTLTYTWAANNTISELDQPPATSTDLRALSPSNGAVYHFYDTSTYNASFNTTSTGGCRHMNFWQNSDEMYPMTDDFETWNAEQDLTDNTSNTWTDPVTGNVITTSSFDLNRGVNVRHHHFPSNENAQRLSIVNNNSLIVPSIGTAGPQTPWNATISMGITGVTSGGGWGGSGSKRTITWNHLNDGNDQGGTNNCTWGAGNRTWGSAAVGSRCSTTSGAAGVTIQQMQQALFPISGSSFIADQPMQVSGSYNLLIYKTNGCFNCGSIRCEIVFRPATGNDVILSSASDSSFEDMCSDNSLANRSGVLAGSFGTIQMQMGDRIFMRGWEDSQIQGRIADESDGDENSRNANRTDHFFTFNVQAATSVPAANQQDVVLNHTVQRLGFQLDDVKIPKDIADKVQGFRIYRAKRDHSNKRIIGQNIVIPMVESAGILGICSEATGTGGAAQQIMGTLQSTPENILSNYPFYEDNGAGFYPIPTVGAQQGMEIYEAVAMYDFNLLRTNNSLAPATHMKVEYIVDNYVFNGPTIRQDQKLTQRIVNSAATGGVNTINEVWGWDTANNCYAQQIHSAIFLGGIYSNATTSFQTNAILPISEFNYVLGQKAKSYVRGDSIFQAGPLGFGGKIFNEFGTSTVALGLKDGQGLPALSNLKAGLQGNNLGDYMFFNLGAASILAVPEPPATTLAVGTNTNASRSSSYLMNLHAFKTDLYKSIDSNILEFTGYEVVGDELQRFVVDEIGTPLNAHANDTTGMNNFTTEEIYGGDTFLCRYGFAAGLTPNNDQQLSEPYRAVHHHIVESPDNINFRHTEDDKSLYFPGTYAKEMLRLVGLNDFNSIDNVKYNDNYSASNDIRPAFPLPSKITEPSDFPTRTHRSTKADTSSLIDNWRIFLANQFKDLPKNRGDLWRLSTFNNLLYFHMEDSLFAAKGKQSMQMNDGSEAFVGSGDIFQQEPDEIIHTKSGFGGTQSQWAALTTRYGYFFVDRNNRKVFLMKDELSEISALGMENWFRDNLGFALEKYKLDNHCAFDNPIKGMGFHSIWDPKYKRIILTKRDLEPTQALLDGLNKESGTYCGGYFVGVIRYNSNKCKYQKWTSSMCNTPPCPCSWEDLEWDDTTWFTQGGWTISYYPEMNIWVSFHDYVPYIYFKTSTNFYSLTDKYPRPSVPATDGTFFGNGAIWEHNSDVSFSTDVNARGVLYQENEVPSYSGLGNAQWLTTLVFHLCEFEFIHNELASTDMLTSGFNYTLEVFTDHSPQTNINILEHGFTSYFVYNTLQISGEQALEYLVNVRRIGNNWKVNNFRDMAATALNTNSYYMSTNTNIIGGLNTGTVTTSDAISMFTHSGMNKTINASYIDLAKNWHEKKKFIDKWIGIRLIYDNVSNNLLNLYSTNVEARKLYR